MKTTTNYKLKQPEGSDTVNIDDLNYNTDIIDIKLKEANDKANNISIPVKSVNNQTGYVLLKANDIKCNDGDSIESHMDDVTKDIGDKTQLKTTNKDNLVSAVNELFINANNGKDLITSVVGNPLLATDTFQQQANKIQELKNILASNLNNKKVNATGTEILRNLINKVNEIKIGDYSIGDEIRDLDVERIGSRNGSLIWKKNFGVIKSLDLDVENNVYINATNKLIKIDNNGTIFWEKSFTKIDIMKIINDEIMLIANSQLLFLNLDGKIKSSYSLPPYIQTSETINKYGEFVIINSDKIIKFYRKNNLIWEDKVETTNYRYNLFYVFDDCKLYEFVEFDNVYHVLEQIENGNKNFSISINGYDIAIAYSPYKQKLIATYSKVGKYTVLYGATYDALTGMHTSIEDYEILSTKTGCNEPYIYCTEDSIYYLCNSIIKTNYKGEIQYSSSIESLNANNFLIIDSMDIIYSVIGTYSGTTNNYEKSLLKLNQGIYYRIKRKL